MSEGYFQKWHLRVGWRNKHAILKIYNKPSSLQGSVVPKVLVVCQFRNCIAVTPHHNVYHHWEEVERSTTGQNFYVCVTHEVYDVTASICKRCSFYGKIALLMS